MSLSINGKEIGKGVDEALETRVKALKNYKRISALPKSFIRETNLFIMDASEGWEAMAGRDVDLADPEHVSGETSIRITTPSEAVTPYYAYARMPITPHLTYASYIHIRLKIDEPANLDKMEFKFYNISSEGAVYYYTYQVESDDTDTDWRIVRIPGATHWSTYGPVPAIEACNRFEIQAKAKAGVTVTVKVDAVQFIKTTPSIIVWCDDGLKSVYDIAFPILKKYPKIKMACAIITSLVGTEDHMTWDEIAEMAADGHLIVSHSHTHRYLNNLSDSALEEELRLSQAALLAHGYVEGLRILVNPGGFGVPKAQKHILHKYYLVERPSSNKANAVYYYPVAPTRLYDPKMANMIFYNITGSVTESSIDTMLDKAVKIGTALEFTFHGFTTDPAEVGSYVIQDTKFDYICNAISSRNIQCVLPTDVFNNNNFWAAETLI
jgi:hypothetical protein